MLQERYEAGVACWVLLLVHQLLEAAAFLLLG
jgi:hypothetical protein